MALSTTARTTLIVAVGNNPSVGKEVADAIDAATAAAAAGANPVAAFVAPIATADATDLASSEALANANKAKINALLAALVASGQMASS